MSKYEKIDLPLLTTADTDSDPYSWAWSRNTAEASMRQVQDAAWDEAWYNNPINALRRMKQISEVEDPNTYDFFGNVDGQREIKRLTREEWKQSPHYRTGLEFDNGVAEETAKIMAARYDERQKRAEILSRKPEGFWSGAAVLGTSFVASALDPTNIAIGMIPILGEAKFAESAGMAVRTASAFSRGATEAAVGTALVEPIIYAAAKQEQADYSANDALMSIAFGGVLGGGVNVLAKGLAGDLRRVVKTEASPSFQNDAPTVALQQTNTRERLSSGTSLTSDFQTHRFTPAEHIDNLQTALAQLATGRTVDLRANVLASELAQQTHWPLISRVDYMVHESAGVPKTFIDERQARRWLNKESEAGNIPNASHARVVANADGTYGVKVETRAKFLTDDNGKIQTFTTPRLAKKALDALPDSPGKRIVELPKVGKDRQFAVISEATRAEANIVERAIGSKNASELRNPARSQADGQPAFTPAAVREAVMKQREVENLVRGHWTGVTRNTADITPSNSNSKAFTRTGERGSDLAKDVESRTQEFELTRDNAAHDAADLKEVDAINDALNSVDEHNAAIDVAVNCLLKAL